jgi:hypothetical protein
MSSGLCVLPTDSSQIDNPEGLKYTPRMPKEIYRKLHPGIG